MIPVVDDLKSSPLVHRFGDCFNPPGLTNFVGCVQADIDLTGIRSLNFPPFACADTLTCALYVNGKYFPSTGSAVTFTWQPDRIERTAEFDGLFFRSITVLAAGKMAAIVRLHIENRSGRDREVALKLGLRGGVTKSVSVWNNATPPSEADNVIEIDETRRALRFTAKNSSAVSVQGTSPPPAQLTANGLRFSLSLPKGATQTISYVNAIAETATDANALFDSLIHRADAEISRAEEDWNTELAAVFTPGNDRYSGVMPTLHTSDRDVLKLYHMGILGVIYFKRDTPFSVHGRAYTTLMPRYWQPVTFLWDYSLSSLVHALLDPAVMRGYLTRWMKLDIHKHFGTEYLTGSGAGQWYSVNDHAMSLMSHDYLRFTGDFAWLDEKTADRSVLDYLHSYATNYKQFQTQSGLADYGGLNNLLECVNTYLHEVASLNAANVFNLRIAAQLADRRGDSSKAADLRRSAQELAAQVQKLYVEGKGFWNARFPDGSLKQVRHIYDFITVLNTMSDDLSASQKREMTDFFQRELQTPTWLHALSCDDDDAMFSVRPDHQWTGAYPAWPPQAVTGLYKIGQVDLAFDWLHGLAKSANQGPFAQAHFAESVIAPDAGGARKAPSEWPYITDWTCSSNGAWTNIIIESIFGVRATMNNGISATPQFGKFDREAVLSNLRYQGKFYMVTRKGLSASP
jgi:hypothetical protein